VAKEFSVVEDKKFSKPHSVSI